MIIKFASSKILVESLLTLVSLINLAVIMRVVPIDIISTTAVVSAAVFFIPTFLGTAFSIPLAMTNTHGNEEILGQLRKMISWSMIAILATAIFIFSFVDLNGHYLLLSLLIMVLVAPTEQFLINITEQRLSIKIFVRSRIIKAFILLLLTQVLLFYEFYLAAVTIPMITSNLIGIIFCMATLKINLFSKLHKSYPMTNTWKLISLKIITYLSNHMPQMFLSRYLIPIDIAAHSNIHRLADFASGFADRPLSSIIMQIANKKYKDDQSKYEFFMQVFSLQLLSSFPIMIMFFVHSDFLFKVFVGERWFDYAPLFSLYVLGGLTNFVLPSILQYFMAVDRISNYVIIFAFRSVTLAIWAIYFVLSIKFDYEFLLYGIVSINIFWSFMLLILFLHDHSEGFLKGVRCFGETAFMPICVGVSLCLLSLRMKAIIETAELNVSVHLLVVCFLSVVFLALHVSVCLILSENLRNSVIATVKGH